MALSSWVDCLVSIRFDLDIGPKIESISPPNAITEEGKIKLLHCAFPDCNPDCGYNFIFYFTLPDCTTVAAQSFSQTVAPPTTGNTVPELYGAAFYRQKHDPNVPRRYVQQVIVLLSHLPYYNVHELILRVVAPRFCQCCPLSPDTGKVPVSSVMSPVPEAYFEVDQSYNPAHYTQEEVLRDAMQELAQWPSPHPQVRYSVNLLQQALVFLTPAHSLRQSIRATRSSCAAVRRAMSVDERVEFVEVARGNARYRGSNFGNDVLPLFSLLGEQLHHLTYVWELLLRHEPLFILSNTPCVASATAFSIASLILPIQFNGTLRSYFTVQNEDFPRLSRMGKALPFPTNEALIVAGTNPFLLRSFSGWPSLLVVMDRNTAHVVNGSVASPSASVSRDSRNPHHPQASPQHGGGGHLNHVIHSNNSTTTTNGLGLGSPVPSSSSLTGKLASATPAPRVVLLDELRAETPPLPGRGTTGLHAAASPSVPNASFPASPSTNTAEATFSSGSYMESSGVASSGPSAIHMRVGSTGSTTANGAASSLPPNTELSSAANNNGSLVSAHHTSTHVTMVPPNTGGSASGVSLSALVRTPTSLADAVKAEQTAVYEADPHAAYALESSSDGSEPHSPSSRPSSAPSHPSLTPAAAAVAAASAGGVNGVPRDGAESTIPAAVVTASVAGPSASTTGVHTRAASTASTATTTTTNSTPAAATTAGNPSSTGAREVSAPVPLSSISNRRQDTDAHSSGLCSPPLYPAGTPAMMPAPSASSVTLFTADNYKTTVESVHAADYRKRGGGHQELSRTNLQQRLHNYFDSSVHFLLNHAEQSKTLLRRLEMVSLLDPEAQRTSVTLSLNQWQGSPTTVSSPWRRSSTSSTGTTSFPIDVTPAASAAAASTTSSPPHAGGCDTATPPHLNRTNSFQRHADPTSMEHGITSCSHFSVADDILRKFFTSLTTEFLTPVTSWYQKVTSPYTAFHLCDRALCDSLLSPASFLADFALRHRETAPSMWTQLHSYKTYKVVYERFANGCLFKAYVCQLIEEDLRRQLENFQIEDWMVRVSSEAERIDLLINLLSTIQRELNETLDPDVLFVTLATSVMASMAVCLREPHREQFMLKIGELKL